ncbi:MAG: DUF21 domain-containing protein [Gammaproteobacteria bacterium]|nr:DUF21 domain-containing protein [Gammaproteobacteria bacterium]NNJ71785.1 DUF21 domain-containing protein [Enterobacterales bacterium]
MELLLIFLFLAIGVSFFCSIFEAVLLSISDSYVAMVEEEGKPFAIRLRAMKDDIDRPLATILSLNTISHTVGAAGVGAQAQIVFGEASLTIVSAILTLLILILSEIIPKTLGARFWRQLAGPTVLALQFLMVALAPLVWLCQKITGSIGSSGHSITFSREEFAAMASRGVEEGIFDKAEAVTFKNLVFFESLTASDVVTPRTVVFSLDANLKISEVVDLVGKKQFSRIPIFGESNEDLLGYVLKHDVLLAAVQQRFDDKLIDLKRDILTTSRNMSLKELFERMTERREHISALVDEYGGFSGLVTMEDIVETILGLEIMDEADTFEDMQILARRYWQKRAIRNGIIIVDEQQNQTIESPEDENPKGNSL